MTGEAPHHLTLVLEAAAFVADKHRMQRREDADASPYINHPLGLARILACKAGITDPVTIAAALLHDTVEDTKTRIEERRARFGEEVADAQVRMSPGQCLEGMATCASSPR